MVKHEVHQGWEDNCTTRKTEWMMLNEGKVTVIFCVMFLASKPIQFSTADTSIKEQMFQEASMSASPPQDAPHGHAGKKH